MDATRRVVLDPNFVDLLPYMVQRDLFAHNFVSMSFHNCLAFAGRGGISAQNAEGHRRLGDLCKMARSLKDTECTQLPAIFQNWFQMEMGDLGTRFVRLFTMQLAQLFFCLRIDSMMNQYWNSVRNFAAIAAGSDNPHDIS